MSKRYYVTTIFAVEAESPQAAEQLTARRIQQFLAGSKVDARIYIDASTDTDETHLLEGPPMLTEETGYIQVPGGKAIPGDGTDDAA